VTDAPTLNTAKVAEREFVFNAIKNFLENRGDATSHGPVELNTPLMNSHLDSLTVLQLMMFLSDELKFELQEDDFAEEHFGTVGSLVGRILERYAAP
jgi:acyl carrier protein